jgi:hypothetical protein
MKFALKIAALAAIAVLALSGVAVAADPAATAYGGLANQQQGAVQGAADTQATSGGSLPFTGFEVGVALVAGLALLGTGMAVRRGARRSEA